MKVVGKSLIIILLYVDDLIFVCNDMVLLEKIKSSFFFKFVMKDFGEFYYCLGIQVKRNRVRR